MSYIRRAWNGDAELWTIFWLGWLWFVLVLFLGIAVGWVGVRLLPPSVHEAFFTVLAIVIAVWWNIWWPVSVWRCSYNTDHAIWTWLARIIAGFQMLMGVLSVLFALYTYTKTGLIPISRSPFVSHSSFTAH